MRKEDIELNLVAERYLQSRLSAEEESEFEEYYLADPEALDELELTQKLREGLQDLATVETLRGRSRQPERPRTFFTTPAYAAAATVFLVVSLAISTTLYQRIEGLEETTPLLSFDTTRIVPLLATRSGAGARELNRIRPLEGEQVVLLVDPGPQTYPGYRLTVAPELGDEPSAPVVEKEGVVPGYQDMLALALPALEPGDYVLRVEGMPDAAESGDGYEYVTHLAFRVEPD